MNSLKHKLCIVQNLTWIDWLALAESWCALFYFRLTLYWSSYEQLSALKAKSGNAVNSPDDWATAQRLHRLIKIASRLHLPAMTCLPQALTLRWMLRRRNIPAQLQIGVQKNANQIFAHAWIEAAGKIIGESEDISQRFEVLRQQGAQKLPEPF